MFEVEPVNLSEGRRLAVQHSNIARNQNMVSDLAKWALGLNRKTQIKGYRLTKDGKLVKSTKHLSVSQRLQQRGSKRIRPARKGET